MISFWEKSSLLQKDIVIIGSGITGLSAAACIKEMQPERGVTVIDQGILPTGASTRNAGFACFGSLSEVIDDLFTMPQQEVIDLVSMRLSGLDILKKRLGEKSIDFQQHGGYEIINEADVHYVEKINFINELLSPLFGRSVYELRDEKISSFGFSSEHIKHLVYTPFEGQLDTGKMMSKLLSYCRDLSVEFITNTPVTKLEDVGDSVSVVLQDLLILNANKVLIATNGLTETLIPNTSVKPARGLLFITAPIPKLKFKGTFHMDKGYYYFRNFNKRVILGGGRNLDFVTEQTIKPGINPLIYKQLEGILKNIILPEHPKSDINIEQTWSGVMGFNNTKKVTIEIYSPNISTAVGLGGMGVAIGSLVGQKLAKTII